MNFASDWPAGDPITLKRQPREQDLFYIIIITTVITVTTPTIEETQPT
jgi:hypothetical protein